jgi:microcin C transport system permease protein
MRWPRLNPITRKRLQRFCRIRRGFYSLLLLTVVFVISLFSEYIANNRAIVIKYDGQYYFPTLKFHQMDTFGQVDDWGFPDIEADYRRLKTEFEGTDNWVLMPPIPYSPTENDFEYDDPPPNPPDGRHILGTDSQGRDVFARLLYGFRISMLFSLCLVAIAQVIGTIIGCLQGYIASWFDIIGQRLIEIWSTLPFLYVVIVLSTFFTPSFGMLLAIMVVFNWIGITYYMRTEIYREKTREYALAAKSLGASHTRIVFKHLLPNALTPLVTLTPFLVVGGIFSLTALDYLGYGLPAPTPSWGEMVDQALQQGNMDKLWLSISPFAAITITLILVTLVGESIREAYDPKEYARYR